MVFVVDDPKMDLKNIPEVALEKIFAFLDPKSLFKVMLVEKCLHNFILENRHRMKKPVRDIVLRYEKDSFTLKLTKTEIESPLERQTIYHINVQQQDGQMDEELADFELFSKEDHTIPSTNSQETLMDLMEHVLRRVNVNNFRLHDLSEGASRRLATVLAATKANTSEVEIIEHNPLTSSALSHLVGSLRGVATLSIVVPVPTISEELFRVHQTRSANRIVVRTLCEDANERHPAIELSVPDLRTISAERIYLILPLIFPPNCLRTLILDYLSWKRRHIEVFEFRCDTRDFDPQIVFEGVVYEVVPSYGYDEYIVRRCDHETLHIHVSRKLYSLYTKQTK